MEGRGGVKTVYSKSLFFVVHNYLKDIKLNALLFNLGGFQAGILEGNFAFALPHPFFESLFI